MQVHITFSVAHIQLPIAIASIVLQPHIRGVLFEVPAGAHDVISGVICRRGLMFSMMMIDDDDDD